MSKRRKILLLLTGLLLVLVLAPFLLAHLLFREPTYEGKTLAYWVGRVGFPSSPEPDQVQHARIAVRTLCKNDIPALVDALNYDYSPRFIRTRGKLAWLPGPIRDKLMDRLFPDHRALRGAIAGRAFWALGPEAAQAVPGLTRLMYSTNLVVAMNAVRALSGMNTNSFPALLRAATDSGCPARCGVLVAIGRMSYLGTNAIPAVPVLVSCTQDKDPQVVEYAVLALGSLDLEPSLTVPAIHKALEHENPTVRAVAKSALTSLDPSSLTNAPTQ
jgi:hypothetical protein